MATDINEIKDQLIDNFADQRTPTTYSDTDYLNFAIKGCKRLYRDTGLKDNWDSEFSVDSLNRDLDINQYEYCVIASEIEILKKIRTSWNTMIGYTTNALTIANADKPFKFLTETIKEKEKELVDLFHKMTDVANMSSISAITVDAVDYDFDD
jgi:hypothetical protein